MQHDVVWTSWDAVDLEHLRLFEDTKVIWAEGTIVAIGEGAVFDATYGVLFDAFWRVRQVEITVSPSLGGSLALWTDGKGHWRREAGAVVPELAGCIDIDISATPFTNTPPIRRLNLCPGESSEIVVGYIDAPTLQVAAVRQRYTCLMHSPEGSRYRFEVLPWKDLPGGFVAELSMDADGLVEDYPPLFHHVPLVKG